MSSWNEKCQGFEGKNSKVSVLWWVAWNFNGLYEMWLFWKSHHLQEWEYLKGVSTSKRNKKAKEN